MSLGYPLVAQGRPCIEGILGDAQIVPGMAGLPQLCGPSEGKEGLGPLCWCFPGCLGDHSGLDKVQVGLMTAVPICPLPVSKWSAVPPEAMVCLGVVKPRRPYHGLVAKLGGDSDHVVSYLQEGLGVRAFVIILANVLMTGHLFWPELFNGLR